MRYTCFDIANYFIRLANETGSFISNLKLQKLVYYAQAWHLAIYGEPLFKAQFQAWVHGPVIRGLWAKYKKYRYNPIDEDPPEVEFDEQTAGFLKEVADVYLGEDAYKLELMTHQEDPWIEARADLPPDAASSAVISNESMKQYFSKRLAS